jgi:hypothetical protein
MTWDDNIKVDLREISCEDEWWTDLAEDRLGINDALLFGSATVLLVNLYILKMGSQSEGR